MNKEERFKVIYGFLHFNGVNHEQLNKKQHIQLMALCDGYGHMSTSELITHGLSWDWSHVRDSSDDALQVVYNQLVAWNFTA